MSEQQNSHQQLPHHLQNQMSTSQNSSGPSFAATGPPQPGIPHPNGSAQQTPGGGLTPHALSQHQGNGPHGVGLGEHLGGISGGPSPGPPAISLLAAAAAAGAGPHPFANHIGFNLELQVRFEHYLNLLSEC